MIASQSQIKAPGMVAASGRQPTQMKIIVGSKSTGLNGRSNSASKNQQHCQMTKFDSQLTSNSLIFLFLLLYRPCPPISAPHGFICVSQIRLPQSGTQFHSLQQLHFQSLPALFKTLPLKYYLFSLNTHTGRHCCCWSSPCHDRRCPSCWQRHPMRQHRC